MPFREKFLKILFLNHRFLVFLDIYRFFTLVQPLHIPCWIVHVRPPYSKKSRLHFAPPYSKISTFALPPTAPHPPPHHSHPPPPTTTTSHHPHHPPYSRGTLLAGLTCTSAKSFPKIAFLNTPFFACVTFTRALPCWSDISLFREKNQYFFGFSHSHNVRKLHFSQKQNGILINKAYLNGTRVQKNKE